MGTRTEYAPGTFSWADLATTDVEGAKSFYGQLFDWNAEETPGGELGTYTMFLRNGRSVAACYEQRDPGVPPFWMSYVTVDDLDGACNTAQELGARVLQEPFDAMGAGRMAVISDPQGAVFALWLPKTSIGAEVVNEPGTLTWNELRTSDTDAAVRFYQALFGWNAQGIDMGPAGTYTTIKVGDRSNGGILPILEQMGPVSPHWGVYFGVEDCDRAVARVQELGGRLASPPMDVPAGRFAVVMDPQGAAFSLFSGEFDR
jgi:predicted enzyme related to lactoylglutathione lyase